MPASKRLKDCILERQKLWEELLQKGKAFAQANEDFAASKQRYRAKLQEIENEMKTCFGTDDSNPSCNKRVIQVGETFYLLDRYPSDNTQTEFPSFVQPIQVER